MSDAVMAAERTNSPDYIDAHAWVFTPASFGLVMLELFALGHIKYRVQNIVESEDTEFFVWMDKSGAQDVDFTTINAERVELLNKTLDLEAQARQVQGNRQSQLESRIQEVERENQRLRSL